MSFNYKDISDTFSVLGVAFVVGAIAQYLRQRSDDTISNDNIMWVSLASGFSAMITVGFLVEYTSISSSFIVAISGLAGWAGIQLLSVVSSSFSQLLVKTAEKKFDVKIDTPLQLHLPVPQKKDEEVNENDSQLSGINSQSE